VARWESVIERWRKVPPGVVDALLALVVAAVTVISVVVNDRQDHGVRLSHVGMVLLVVELVPLVWRRRAPVTVFAISGIAGACYGIRSEPDPTLFFAPLLALYTVAAYKPRRVSVPILASVLGVSVVAFALSDNPDASDIAVGYLSWLTAWFAGDMIGAQREQVATVAARRADELRAAAMTERLAIARDLHDIVAHNVSVIAVQAEAAQAVLAADPARVERAMGDVADTARTTLVELRRLLGVLRSEHEFAPQPGLDAIDDLVATVRRAGMDVALSRSGAADGHSAGAVNAVTGLTAYRVVQEALTNVLKHAGPCATNVALEVENDSLVGSIVDDGCGPVASNGGHGLVGMRERVAVVGGRLDAGPRAGGGFAVRAWLPLTA
jgi:signal transduction histidine kinase